VEYSNISGVILAGGANRRFDGKIKSKVDIGGKPIISRIIDTIGDVFSEIIIVTNAPEEFKEFSSFTITADHFLNAGPLGGIHSALKASSKEAIFVFAGDMPLLDKKIITGQIEDFKNNPCDILIPAVGKNIEPLHAIYNSSVGPDLENYLSGNNSFAIREFVRHMNVRYMVLEKSEEIIIAFTNINTPEDKERIENMLK
jgi:molybdopterin-guanine dinucleotide biosynthesis protein A